MDKPETLADVLREMAKPDVAESIRWQLLALFLIEFALLEGVDLDQKIGGESTT